MKRFTLTVSQKSAEGKVGHAVGEDIEALQKPKGGETDRPRRERCSKARTVPVRGIKGRASKWRDSGASSGRKPILFGLPEASRGEAPRGLQEGTETSPGDALCRTSGYSHHT